MKKVLFLSLALVLSVGFCYADDEATTKEQESVKESFVQKITNTVQTKVIDAITKAVSGSIDENAIADLQKNGKTTVKTSSKVTSKMKVKVKDGDKWVEYEVPEDEIEQELKKLGVEGMMK